MLPFFGSSVRVILGVWCSFGYLFFSKLGVFLFLISKN